MPPSARARPEPCNGKDGQVDSPGAVDAKTWLHDADAFGDAGAASLATATCSSGGSASTHCRCATCAAREGCWGGAEALLGHNIIRAGVSLGPASQSFEYLRVELFFSIRRSRTSVKPTAEIGTGVQTSVPASRTSSPPVSAATMAFTSPVVSRTPTRRPPPRVHPAIPRTPTSRSATSSRSRTSTDRPAACSWSRASTFAPSAASTSRSPPPRGRRCRTCSKARESPTAASWVPTRRCASATSSWPATESPAASDVL